MLDCVSTKVRESQGQRGRRKKSHCRIKSLCVLTSKEGRDEEEKQRALCRIYLRKTESEGQKGEQRTL
jgi:hypothetical protein